MAGPSGPSAGVGMNTPASIVGKGASELLRQYWSNKVYYESLQVDPLMTIPELTEPVDPGNDREEFSLKEGYLFHDITPSGKDIYSRSVRLQLTNALLGAAQEGDTAVLLGNEEDIRIKQFTAFANDWMHAVATQTYGITFRENAPTQIYERAKDLLSQWLGEYMGWNARMGIIERVSSTLTQSPVSLTAFWNQNWYNVGATSQPAYDSVNADYLENIATSLNTITTPATDSHLDITEILAIGDNARERYIKPIPFEGHDLYFMYVAPEEYRRLRDPGITGSFGNYWVEAAALGSGQLDKIIPGEKMVVGEVVVCRDNRCAAIGEAEDVNPALTTLNAYYLKQGRNDERNAIAESGTWNANLLLGSHSLVKFQSEKPHFEEQYDEYSRFKGVGYTGACGYQVPAFDLDTKTDTSVQQEGSMVVLTNRE